jgi:hypothetical protein
MSLGPMGVRVVGKVSPDDWDADHRRLIRDGREDMWMFSSFSSTSKCKNKIDVIVNRYIYFDF